MLGWPSEHRRVRSGSATLSPPRASRGSAGSLKLPSTRSTKSDPDAHEAGGTLPPASQCAPSFSPERPDLDRPRFGDWVSGRDLDGLLQAFAFDDVEPADCLLGLDEWPVGDDRLSAADAD